MKKVNHKTISSRRYSNNKIVRILAIESSCDETSASIIEAELKTKNEKYKTIDINILSNIISSQVKLHAKFGGVYPELASREHIRNILPVIQEAIAEIPISKSQSPNKLEIINSKISNNKNFKIELLNENYKLKIENYIDAIAVTTGPGLIGSLLVGINTAKTLAYTFNKPIYAINHLEGHIYSCFTRENLELKTQIFNQAQNSNVLKLNHLNFNKNLKLKIKNLPMPQFPLVALVVSGGHTSLVLMKDHFDYEIIGETLDDAAGEVFDKVARMLDLGYPGGPAIAKMAEKVMYNRVILNDNEGSNQNRDSSQAQNDTNKSQIQNPKKPASPSASQGGLSSQSASWRTNKLFSFPRPMINSNNFDFSFSGLKTSVLYAINKLPKPLSSDVKCLICNEFQEAVVETLVTKTLKAANEYGAKSVILCGGVSANSRLREEFTNKLKSYEANKLSFFVPDISLTGDNAAMIGIAAAYRIALGKKPTPWHNVNASSNYKLS
jgi:N6-L-threonylcarbamoyladenine synthase